MFEFFSVPFENGNTPVFSTNIMSNYGFSRVIINFVKLIQTNKINERFKNYNQEHFEEFCSACMYKLKNEDDLKNDKEDFIKAFLFMLFITRYDLYSENEKLIIL